MLVVQEGAALDDGTFNLTDEATIVTEWRAQELVSPVVSPMTCGIVQETGQTSLLTTAPTTAVSVWTFCLKRCVAVEQVDAKVPIAKRKEPGQLG